MADAAGLTGRQRRFCDEYIIDPNGRQSAIKAGYSVKTACEIAYRLLKKPQICSYIEQRKAEIQAKIELTQEEIRRILKEIAESSSANTSDRLRALELIMKEKGMFKSENPFVAVFQSPDISKMGKAIDMSICSKVDGTNNDAETPMLTQDVDTTQDTETT